MNERTAGRLAGGLFLIQFAAGVAVNTVLTAPLFGAAGYLASAAAAGTQLGWSVLLALAGAVVTVAIAVIVFAPLRQCSPRWSLAFLSLSLVAASLSAVEQGGVLAMRAFSESFAAGDAPQRELLQSLSVAGASLRNSMHYISLLFSGVTLAAWYGGCLRYLMLPRTLAALGLIAVALQLYTIGRAVLGAEVIFPLLAPLALAQLLTSLWLLWRGLPSRAPVG